MIFCRLLVLFSLIGSTFYAHASQRGVMTAVGQKGDFNHALFKSAVSFNPQIFSAGVPFSVVKPIASNKLVINRQFSVFENISSKIYQSKEFISKAVDVAKGTTNIELFRLKNNLNPEIQKAIVQTKNCYHLNDNESLVVIGSGTIVLGKNNLYYLLTAAHCHCILPAKKLGFLIPRGGEDNFFLQK